MIDSDCWVHKGFEFWLTVVVRFVTIIIRRIHVDTVQAGLTMVKSVCSSRDSGWGSLGDWEIGSRINSGTKDSGLSYNQRI